MNLTTETKSPQKVTIFGNVSKSGAIDISKAFLSETNKKYLKLQEELTFWNWTYQKIKFEENVLIDKNLSEQLADLEMKYKDLLREQDNERENLRLMMKSEIQTIEPEVVENESPIAFGNQLEALRKEFQTLLKVKNQLQQEIDFLKAKDPQFTKAYEQCHEVLMKAYMEREKIENELRNEIKNLTKVRKIEELEGNSNENEINLKIEENLQLEKEVDEWKRELWLLEKSIWKRKEGYYTDEEVEKLIAKEKEDTEGYKLYLNNKLKELEISLLEKNSKLNLPTPKKSSKLQTKLSKFLELSSEKPGKGLVGKSDTPYMKEFESFFNRKIKKT